MNRSRRNLWLTSMIVILPLIGTALYLVITVAPKEKRPSAGSPPTQWFSYPRSVEGEALIGTQPESGEGTYPVFSSRYGRISCFLDKGVRVKLLKKWWSRYEKRFYYRVTDGSCTGWVPENSLVLATENDEGEPDSAEPPDIGSTQN